jgi:hypothetical protein
VRYEEEDTLHMFVEGKLEGFEPVKSLKAGA